MNKIVIESIEFENYRQYGDMSIHFSSSNDKNLNVIIAQNGTGKTTLLNAITWCLYGEEIDIKDSSRALSRLNTGVKQNAESGKTYPVSVKLKIKDKDKNIDFIRTQNYKVDEITNNAIGGNTVLEVHMTNTKDGSNTEVLVEEYADNIVRQYFNKDIHEFYFFNGEKLEDFFEADKKIKDSIFSISQVFLLENVCNHIANMETKYSREASRFNSQIGELNNDKKRIKDTISVAKESLKDSEKNKAEYEKKKKQKDDLLRDAEPTKKLQENKDELDAKRNQIEKELDDIAADKSRFIREYSKLILLYPKMKSIFDYIEIKERNDELPPSIDKDQVKELLEEIKKHLVVHCPICDHKIDESGADHLNEILNKISVSSATSNFLKEIKGPIEESVLTVKDYPSAKKEILEREMNKKKELSTIESSLEQINKTLMNMPSNDKKVKFKIDEVAKESAELENNIHQEISNIAVQKEKIRRAEKELKDVEKNIEKEKAKIKKNELIKKKCDVASALDNDFKIVLNNITDNMKEKIKEKTCECFDAMNWKIKTFGEIEIHDNYTIDAYNIDGDIMTESLGATEKMSLAYSYILAIHDTSGKNCPLVIDSPIGRSSDTNREDISGELLNVSKNKQIIMLFTPDDYTENVAKQYDNKVNLINLKLDKTESQVKKG